MNQRERMLVTLNHKIPDMVPCCPDISVMVPLKMKNKPFWEFYINEKENIFYDLYNNENILNAYLDACRYFNVAAWAWYVAPIFKNDDVVYEHKIIDKNSLRIVTRTIMKTPEGDLESETIFPIDNPPTPYKKFIKDFEKEFKFLKYFYPTLKDIDFSPVLKEKELVGDLGVSAVGVLPPSLSQLEGIVDGGLSKLGLIYYDYPDLFSKYKEIHENWSIEYLKKIIDENCCDEILTGGAGLITWQGPAITRNLSLEGLKQITRICKDNNIISHLHCCGFENKLVKMCTEETDLDVIEPLEVPPTGDCNLKDLKQKYGSKLVFKGNLHTTNVMLSDVKTVEEAAIKCIMDAKDDGGLILSTGDQCGRDTPHENIFKLVEVCEKYGRY